jgi:hypothetical protein
MWCSLRFMLGRILIFSRMKRFFVFGVLWWVLMKINPFYLMNSASFLNFLFSRIHPGQILHLSISNICGFFVRKCLLGPVLFSWVEWFPVWWQYVVQWLRSEGSRNGRLVSPLQHWIFQQENFIAIPTYQNLFDCSMKMSDYFKYGG